MPPSELRRMVIFKMAPKISLSSVCPCLFKSHIKFIYDFFCKYSYLFLIVFLFLNPMAMKLYDFFLLTLDSSNYLAKILCGQEWLQISPLGEGWFQMIDIPYILSGLYNYLKMTAYLVEPLVCVCLESYRCGILEYFWCRFCFWWTDYQVSLIHLRAPW